jgi:BirA family biotin operon repressor/biotin-[acetyl-CoA-carboxylase] ligase
MKQFTILRFTELDSTNKYALEHLDSLSDRHIILAERQSLGYGRLGRSWISDNPGNLYMSMVLKSPSKQETPLAVGSATQYMSVTLCKLLLQYGVTAAIKWPNDVRVQGAKIAGLLGETRFRGDHMLGCVLGCGVNLNMSEEEVAVVDQRATSLNLLIGEAVDRDGFLDSLLMLFFKEYDGFLRGGFPFIRETYVQMCDFLGKPVVVKSFNNDKRGIATTFTDRGELVLKDSHDGKLVLNSGDVETLRIV